MDLSCEAAKVQQQTKAQLHYFLDTNSNFVTEFLKRSNQSGIYLTRECGGYNPLVGIGWQFVKYQNNKKLIVHCIMFLH